MKKDKFYLIAGIAQIILSVFLLFRVHYIIAILLFILGILTLLKDYFRLFKK